MPKLALNNISAGFASTAALNANFDAVEVAIEKTLSRDGTTPNHMLADLDMNGYSIINESAQSGFGFIWKGAWLADKEYQNNNLVNYNGSTYICKYSHTSTDFNIELASGYWEVLASKGIAGDGAGDMVAANNLGELTATAATARVNISAAKSGDNSDITNLTGLAIPLTTAQGGTGSDTEQAAINRLSNVASALEGQVLTKVSGDATWASASGVGLGDVSGPASSLDRYVAVFSGTSGKVIDSSTIPEGNLVTTNTTQTLSNKTLTSSLWNGSAVGATYGGTGTGTYSTGDVLYASSPSTLSKRSIGTDGQVLTVSGGIPTWSTPSGTGVGNVVGPSSAADNSVALFNGTTGKIIKDGNKSLPVGSLIGTTDTQTLTNKTMSTGSVWNGTDIAIADGGTGASTAQTAINNLTAVSGATVGHVLTKVGSNATWAATSGSGSSYEINILDYGAVGDGTTNCTTAIDNAITAMGTVGTLIVPEGSYLYSGTVYKVPWDHIQRKSGFTISNTQVMAFARQFQTYHLFESDLTLSNEQMGIQVLGKATGTQHTNAARFLLQNSATNSTGNTAVYGQVSSDTDGKWSSAVHGETRAAGAAATMTAAGTFEIVTYSNNSTAENYGVIIQNASGSHTSENHPMTGGLPTSAYAPTALLIAGTTDVAAGTIGGWSLGLHIKSNAMRSDGICIYIDTNATYKPLHHIYTTTTSGTSSADILLRGDSPNGIVLQGTYGTNAIRVNTGQSLSFDGGSQRIYAGTGAPSAADATGSIYIRLDGGTNTTLYVRRAGAWAAVAV